MVIRPKEAESLSEALGLKAALAAGCSDPKRSLQPSQNGELREQEGETLTTAQQCYFKRSVT